MPKTTLITGGTDGIGRAIVSELLTRSELEDRIVVNYGHDDRKARDMILTLPEPARRRVFLEKADLSSMDALMDFAAMIRERYPSLDHLICNVGIGQYAKFDDYTPELWNHVINTNLTCPTFLIKELRHSLNPGGSILLMGSYAGKKEYSSSVVYSISKAGILFLAKALVKELEPDGIRINAIAPGFIETGWQAGRSDESRARIGRKIALHRFGTPEEVADISCGVLFNTYMNGAVVDVTGGYEYF